MSSKFPEIHLVRHGETEWSASGKHTGRTDIPLTPAGEEAARGIALRLQGLSFQSVWSSPSQRARETSRLAGFGSECVVKDDLAEWDYGAYEGLTTKEILAQRPGWQLFRDGCPDGESVADAGARADRDRCGAARRRRQCAGVFERAFPAGARGALAGIAAAGRRAFRPRYGQHQHTRLRARPHRACHPPVESKVVTCRSRRRPIP